MTKARQSVRRPFLRGHSVPGRPRVHGRPYVLYVKLSLWHQSLLLEAHFELVKFRKPYALYVYTMLIWLVLEPREASRIVTGEYAAASPGLKKWGGPTVQKISRPFFWLALVVVLARRALCFDIQPIYRYPIPHTYSLLLRNVQLSQHATALLSKEMIPSIP